MKKITSYIILLLVGGIFFSCTKDFSELNTNPNAPTEVNAELLLRRVVYDLGDEMSYEGFVAGNLLGQHFTMVDFNLFDRHNLSQPQLGGNPWPTLYKNLRDVNTLIDQSRTNAAEEVYEGPALVMKSYIAAMLTDIYGNVPYFEAAQGQNGVVAPEYDLQEDIYLNSNGILDNLEKAIALMEGYQGAISLEGDILCNGDLSYLITFGKSLQIKYLMRISGQVDVQNELQTIFSEGYYMQNAGQDATFQFTAGMPNSFRMQQLRDGDFNLFVMSETMQEVLEDLNDPRIEVLFRPYSNAPNGTEFSGLLNGPDASTTSISVADYSLTGVVFRESTDQLQSNFMTSWETQFLLAEAAQRGLIAAPAEDLYNAAIDQAMNYWNLTLPSDYLSGNAAFGADGQDPLEQILTQKWIASSINGYEGWIEFRRTGFPALKDIDASLNGGVIPVRMPYPADEEALNANNFGGANAAPGNSVNEPVWWDVQ